MLLSWHAGHTNVGHLHHHWPTRGSSPSPALPITVLGNIVAWLFLLLQGSMFNTWKPMWVVLLEDGIEFYKKKSDNSPKGMIPLKGSTLTSPCQDFGKRMVGWHYQPQRSPSQTLTSELCIAYCVTVSPRASPSHHHPHSTSGIWVSAKHFQSRVDSTAVLQKGPQALERNYS